MTSLNAPGLSQACNGILLVNKPLLLSSNAVLQQAKRLFGASKAGHMGALDPLATGMLPVCFGEATKFAHYGLEADKCYAVTALFGIKTTTGDAEGSVLAEVKNVQLSVPILQSILADFRGDIRQIPPMYSALKHQGKKLYEFARKGIEIERPARPVTIHSLELTYCDSPQATFEIHCSKGTYIRTLIEDMGEALRLGAHVTQLHRLYTAGFEDQPMYSLEELTTLSGEEKAACLLPVDYMVRDFPLLTLTADLEYSLYRGQPVVVNTAINTGYVRIYNEAHAFRGLAEYDAATGILKAKRLMKTDG